MIYEALKVFRVSKTGGLLLDGAVRKKKTVGCNQYAILVLFLLR